MREVVDAIEGNDQHPRAEQDALYRRGRGEPILRPPGRDPDAEAPIVRLRTQGQKLKGRVWLFATGQQKLEDQLDSNNIGKLKDRFPSHLRVHLATTNIRDVVHKRLLKKRPDNEPALRELFQKHRGDLKLYGYGCEEITEEDFVEVYPMLPGHVDLLMQITSNLRTRSTRVQGDDHAIHGLLQLLGELFREQELAGGRDGLPVVARLHLRSSALGSRR